MSSRSATAGRLAEAGLRELADALAEREVSSREAVAAALERIDARQADLNAFRVVRHEAALAEAEAADARIEAGERLPLLGVPVAIKDDMDLAGESTQMGCEGEFEPARDDGGPARRLREAGAVIVGKTRLPEFGQWPFTESLRWGATRNPWHTDHTPGGSSGGSAAAVAAGLVPAAVGSDGAGSVRIPAAWTGLVGLKPQRGRISTLPHAEAFHGLSCYGPLARTVADTALLLDVLAGPLPGDRHTPPAPAEPFVDAVRREPRRLRIAVSFNAPFSAARLRLDPEVRGAVERIAHTLADLGHDVRAGEPSYGGVGPAFVPRAFCGVADCEALVPDPELLDPRSRATARSGRALRPLLPLARAAEGVLKRQIGGIFERADVVLTPTTALPPPPVGAHDELSGWGTDQAVTKACPYTYAWNVTGWPALSVPAGLTAAGLPVGAQLMGRENDEATLLSLAAQLERVERWYDRRPPAQSADADR